MMLALDAPRPRVSVDRTAPFLWYTLSVIPQSQARVCQRARELGIETYVPMSRTPPMVRKFGRQRVTEAEVRPLMPGYVFVSMPRIEAPFGLFDPRYGSEALRGSLGFISCEQGSEADRWPMPVHEAVIEDMRHREAMGEFDLTAKTDSGRGSVAKWVRRGSFVEIISGPFKSFLGKIERVKSSKLVTLAVTMLGDETPMDTPIDYIAWRGRGSKP